MFKWFHPGFPSFTQVVKNFLYQILICVPINLSYIILVTIFDYVNANWTKSSYLLITHQLQFFSQISLATVAPEVLPFEFIGSLQEGERIGVTCIVTKGDPPVTIRWLKNDQQLPNDIMLNDILTISNTEFSSTLMITHLASKHNGIYKCLAANSVAESSHSAELIVYGR